MRCCRAKRLAWADCQPGRTSGQRGREEGGEGGGGYGSEGRRRKEPQRWPGGAEHARTHSAAAARAFLSLSPSPYTHSAPLQAARRRPPPPNLSLRCLFFAQSDFPSPPAASLLPHVPNRLPVATTTAAPECVGTHSSSPPGPAADVAEYDEEGRRGESSSPFPSHLPPYLHRLRARGAWLC